MKTKPEFDTSCNGMSINGTPVTVGMRIIDLAGPAFIGVVIGTASNGVAYRIVANESGMNIGDISIAEWPMVAICPAPPEPPSEPPPEPSTPPTSDVDRIGEIFKSCMNDAELIRSLLKAFDECGRLPGNLAMRAILTGWQMGDDHEQRAEALWEAIRPRWERPFCRP